MIWILALAAAAAFSILLRIARLAAPLLLAAAIYYFLAR